MIISAQQAQAIGKSKLEDPYNNLVFLSLLIQTDARQGFGYTYIENEKLSEGTVEQLTNLGYTVKSINKTDYIIQWSKADAS